MDFIAKCTKCNETLNIDPTEKKINCTYCGAPYVFERTDFSSDMADEAKVKNEIIKKYDAKLTLLKEKFRKLNAKKQELEKQLKRKPFLFIGRANRNKLKEDYVLIKDVIKILKDEIIRLEKIKEKMIGVTDMTMYT
jgi:hypothetical protein